MLGMDNTQMVPSKYRGALLKQWPVCQGCGGAATRSPSSSQFPV